MTEEETEVKDDQEEWALKAMMVFQDSLGIRAKGVLLVLLVCLAEMELQEI